MNIISVYEQARVLTDGDCNGGWWGWAFGQYDASGNEMRPLHNNGMNFAFCDGHAKWYSVVDHPGWDDPLGDPRNSPGYVPGTWPERQLSFAYDYCP